MLQHEMERRFAETLFGTENLSAEAENSVLARRPVIAETKTTELWELRTLFGPRGSPPKPLEDLPAEVRAWSFFDVWSLPRCKLWRWAARFPNSAARTSV